MQPTPVLSLGSDLQSPSLSSQPSPTLAGEQTSLSGWLVLVGTDPLCRNFSALLCTPVFALSSMAPKLPLHPPPYPPNPRLHQWRVFLVCGNFSSFTAHSQRCRSHPYSFVSVFFFFLLPYPGTCKVSCLLGSLRSSASIQYRCSVWGLLPAFSRCSVGVL